jgi:hypothetical protein
MDATVTAQFQVIDDCVTTSLSRNYEAKTIVARRVAGIA